MNYFFGKGTKTGSKNTDLIERIKKDKCYRDKETALDKELKEVRKKLMEIDTRLKSVENNLGNLD